MESMCYTYILKCSDGTYYEEFQGKQEAMKREYAIKQLTRKEKENLIKEKNMQQKGSQDTERGSEQNQNL